jgi:GNAT superfamily N-acetyltransferase
MLTGADRDDALLAEAIEAEAWADMTEAAPPAFLDATGLRCLRRGGATCLVTPRMPIALMNRAMGLGCQAAATPGDLDEVLAIYRQGGVRRFWIQMSPAARPPAVGEWLRARELAPDAVLPAWAKVLRGPAEAPEVRTLLRVEAVGAERAVELGEVLASAHDMPASFASWFAALAGRPRWQAYAAFDAGRIVAGGMLHVSGARAWLGAGGTLPSHRGRGGQTALMACRIAGAIARGCTAIATETGDRPGNPSLHNMLRCGFRRVSSRINYGPAGASPG